jgi:transposase
MNGGRRWNRYLEGFTRKNFVSKRSSWWRLRVFSSREAARRLSIPPGSLKNWVHAARAGKLKEVGKAHKPLTDLELELARTRKELAEVKQERDLLKKFAAYFAKESR